MMLKCLTNDRFDKVIEICWYVTLVSSFFGAALLPVKVGPLGTFYLFRFMVLITGALFLIKAVSDKFVFFKEQSKLIKSVYILFLCMIAYSGFSIVIAINTSVTFSMAFNLFLDLLFCFLAINFISKNLKKNIIVILASLTVLQLLGIFETIFGGIFTDAYAGLARYSFFGLKILGRPTVGFGNTNDYVSAVAMVTIAVTWVLIINMKNLVGKEKRIAAGIIVFINSAAFYLSACAISTLVSWVMLLQIFLLFVYTIIFNRKFKIAFASMLVLFAFIHLMPTAQKYMVIIENNINTFIAQFNTSYTPEIKDIPNVYGDDVGLDDQFVDDDGEISTNVSGGIRLTLLKYSFNTMIDSYGLGVGLGNTGVMAANDEIIPRWEGSESISMHCFPARILADMGIFIMLPVLLVFFYIFKSYKIYMKKSKDNRKNKFLNILFLGFGLLSFAILSTASSDAQDILPMWLFIAIIILIADRLRLKTEQQI